MQTRSGVFPALLFTPAAYTTAVDAASLRTGRSCPFRQWLNSDTKRAVPPKRVGLLYFACSSGPVRGVNYVIRQAQVGRIFSHARLDIRVWKLPLNPGAMIASACP